MKFIHQQLPRTVLITLAIVASACGSDQLTGPEDFQMARMRWSQRGPDSYTVTVNFSCYCAIPPLGPVDVTVQDGVVKSRRYVASGEDVPAAYTRVYPSVAEFFENVNNAIQSDTRPFELKFDEKFGYPTRFAIGDPALDSPVTTASNLRAQ